ncbi:MAG: 3-deoxy-7-phosphoheptulonate synthase, partial [Planctomycetaceae bacterium]|nr:3-deoxy-7-phosphoheptulonate synthase [Planctomycetaceae bacterium]
MIIVMKADASPEQISKVAEQVENIGLKPHVIKGSERTVIAVVGDEQDATVSAMETVPGVARVLPILAPYKV